MEFPKNLTKSLFETKKDDSAQNQRKEKTVPRASPSDRLPGARKVKKSSRLNEL